MKRFIYSAGVTSLLAFPFAFAAAQSSGRGLAEGPTAGGFQNLLVNILAFSNTVLIPFIIGIGFLVFVWGMFQYFIFGGANDDAKDKGKSLMIYATLGFVLIIVFWGIINLLSTSTGLDGGSQPVVPGATLPSRTQ